MLSLLYITYIFKFNLYNISFSQQQSTILCIKHKKQIMNNQEVILCEKHKKRQTNMLQIPTNYYVCLNRYCPHAYHVLCNLCKVQHRDHQVKVLSIQDIAFLIDRLLKMPFKQAGTYIVQSIQILKKLKLVNQFSKKITKILKQLQQQTLDFITMTENIISDYAQCKTSALQLSQLLFEVESKQAFDNFRKNGIKKLSKVDYNIQKDRLEYGSLEIKEKEDVRRKNLTFIKRRVEEVKQYSMKVIQVILNNDESDQEEQDIASKKKQYQILKNEAAQIIKQSQQGQKQSSNGKNGQKIEQKPGQAVDKKPQKRDMQIQTQNTWLQQLQKTIKSLNSQLQASNFLSKKQQSQYKSKLQQIQKQKQTASKQRDALKKQKDKILKQYQQKCQFFNHYERRLRDNFQKRSVRYRERQEIIKQLAELVEHQRVDSRGRDSLQKENRNNSKNKKG